jgi:hypothetical protein
MAYRRSRWYVIGPDAFDDARIWSRRGAQIAGGAQSVEGNGGPEELESLTSSVSSKRPGPRIRIIPQVLTSYARRLWSPNGVQIRHHGQMLLDSVDPTISQCKARTLMKLGGWEDGDRLKARLSPLTMPL